MSYSTPPPNGKHPPNPASHTTAAACQKRDCLCGLTLRDWFAGQVLSNPHPCELVGANSAFANAETAYDHADAMLFLREEEGG